MKKLLLLLSFTACAALAQSPALTVMVDTNNILLAPTASQFSAANNFATVDAVNAALPATNGVAKNLSVIAGLGVTGGLSVEGGGANVTGGLTIASGGLNLTGTFNFASSGLFNKAIYVDGSGNIVNSATTGTELGYLSGVTSGVQGQLNAIYGGSTVQAARLIEWTAAGAYQITSATIDSDGCVSSAVVVWPDGSGGTFTRTAKDTIWLVVNAYTITHTASSKTITQGAVTRDSATGVATAAPALTVM